MDGSGGGGGSVDKGVEENCEITVLKRGTWHPDELACVWWWWWRLWLL